MRGRANSPLTGCLLPACGSHFLCWILRVVPSATLTSVFPGVLARSKLHVPEPGLIFTLCFSYMSGLRIINSLMDLFFPLI